LIKKKLLPLPALLCLLAQLLLLLALPASASPDRRVALVIGNGAYKDAPLSNPLNDATAIAAILEELGFEVVTELDADRRTMARAISAFGERLRTARAGLFYYAGHGLQSQGRNYLVPVGAMIQSEVDFEFEAVDANRVLRQMEQARAGMNIVILDACRNNPFRSIFRSTAEDGLTSMSAPRGSLIAYATSPHNVALDGDGRHSPYTANLLKNLIIPGLSIEDVFKRVREGVLTETHGRQVTWESSSLVGNFYFIAPDHVQITTTAPGPDPELLFWESIAASSDPREFEAYLRQYPEGRFADLARVRVKKMQDSTHVLGDNMQLPHEEKISEFEQDVDEQELSDFISKISDIPEINIFLPIYINGMSSQHRELIQKQYSLYKAQQWMDSRSYQNEFNTQFKKKYFPAKISAQCVGFEPKFKGLFLPFPSENFKFWSYHGLDRSKYLEREKYMKRNGYENIWNHNFFCNGKSYYQATWVKK
jgi:hypothetical protein